MKIFTQISLLIGLFILVQGRVTAQIAITVTGNTNTTPNLMATYTSLALALTDVNLVTAMTGPVTLTCAAATSETAPVTGLTIGSATLNPVLSATNTITIIKASGTVTLNAGTGTATPGSAAPDGMLKLSGADFITIDGLTFTDGNVTNPATMEFGVALFKRVAGDGCNNNTIQNCTFNMQRINNAAGTSPMVDGAVGILVINSTAATATTLLTPTNGGTLPTNGTNSGNKFYTNTINSGNIGIALSGFAASSGAGPTPVATTFLGDLGNDIGGIAMGTGNSVLNFGGGAVTNAAAGIRANNQWSVNISYNTIDNNDGLGVSHATTLRGIFAQAGTSANATINNNNVTARSGATTSTLTAIDNGIGSTASSNTININNNTIRLSYTTATTGLMTAISNSATAAAVNINSNNIQGVSSTNYPSTGTILMIVGGSPGGTLSVSSNTISNFTLTGTSGIFRAITASTPTGLYTVNGNSIENISYTAATSTGNITGIYNLASATLQNVNNNIIRNFSTPTTGTLNGIQKNTVVGTFQCQNNQIYNFSTTSGGVGGFSANGITWSNASVTISGNLIYAINSTGTTGGIGGVINGITFSGAATVTRNAIYDLSSNSTNVVINGINVAATGTNNVNNNLIGDLRAPNSTGNIAISGILVGSGTTNNIFHNTVNIASTTTSATTFGTSAIFFSSSTPVNNLRNNIFVNTSAPGPTGGFTAAIRYAIAPTSTNFPAANNNNFYYAGTAAANRVLYCEGSSATPSNGQQTIANYKTYINTTLPVAGRESSSVSEIPNWVSTTGSNPITDFLKYNTGIATQIEQGAGVGTGISTDYAATTRCPGGGCPGSAATPDMGAWEQNGTALDLSGPAISYTNLSNTSCLTAPALSAVITDASSVNTTAGTKPRLYYRKSTANNAIVGNTNADNGWKFVEASNAASPFTFTLDYSIMFGGVPVVGDIIQYFVVAQDLAGTPNIGINSGTFSLAPASVALTGTAAPIGGSINSYTIITAGISGTVNVGAAETYKSLTEVGALGLFNTVNTVGLTGNITVVLMDASITETGAIALNTLVSSGCAAGTYTMTIKPNTITTLTGSVASGALIKLNGADGVTIDGSNSGGTDKSLTISNTSTATNTAAIWVSSLGTALGATNNTIKNCNIAAGNIGTAANTFGIYVGGTSISTSGTGNDNDDLTINNNAISKAYYGIYAQAAATGVNNNLAITSNTIGSATATDYVTFRGLLVTQADNATVSQNTVFNMITAEAIVLRAMEFGLGVTNSAISRNSISNIEVTGAGKFRAGQGISVTTASPANVTISNNEIYGLKGEGSTTMTNNSLGIAILSGGGFNVYYNSVNISDARTTTSSTDLHACMYIASGVTNLDVRNNVFNMTAIAGNLTSGKTYGIYCLSANTAFTTINYNDYYAPGTSNRFAGFLTSDRTTLADIQSGFGTNTNSLVVDPSFNSNTNLKPQLSSPLLGAGTTIGGITIDFLGVTRGGTPTIGAYEAGVDGASPVITYTNLLGTCSTGDRTLTATITDVSGVSIAGALMPRIYYRKNAGTWFSSPGTLSSGSGTNGTWSFTIVAADMGGLVVADAVQYYVIAQDIASPINIASNPAAGLVATNVNTVTTPPTTPNTYSIQNTLSAGTYTVGSGGAYATLTAAVAAYNTSCLTGAIVFSLTDASYSGSETFPLTINVNGDASATNTLIIRPAGIATTIIGSNTTAILNLNGARYVTIDGLNAGGSSLLIRNTASGPAIRYINDAIINTVINATLESANTSTISGTLFFSTSTGTLGNSNNIINSCTIRDRSDAAGIPANAVYSSGSASALNASNAIQNCNVFNFTNAGVLVSSTGAGNSWTVNPSSFYATISLTTAVTAISIQGGSGHSILSNSIGGTAPNAAGSNLVTSSQFTGISLGVGTALATSVQGNTIKNIRSTFSGGFTASYGITLTIGLANIGNITGNTIGSNTVSERFEISGDCIGISISSASNLNLSNNTVVNFGTAAGAPAGQYYFGIQVAGIGSHTIVNNTVANLTNASTPDATFNTETIGMNITATGIETVRGNLIRDIGSTSAAAPTSLNNRVWGLIISGTAVGTVVEKNTIYNVYALSAGTGARADRITLLQSQSLANATYSNNMLSGSDLSGSSDRAINGILDLSASPSISNYYFNTVNIYGTATAANNTYAFNRNSTATVTIRDNIFSNVRTGGSGFHVAIANTNAAATGWASTASDYNDLYSATASTLGQWLGFAAGNNRDFAAWKAAQAAGSGGDANSVNIAPIFTSNTNLHLTNANTSLNNIGTTIAGITQDLDNETRFTTPGPDMGADEFEPLATLNLTAFIEGFMSGTGTMRPVLMNSGIGMSATDCDNVTIELRNATAPYALAYTFTGILQTNGTITCTYPGSGAVIGNSYYIVIKHRNGLETWSATAQSFTLAPKVYNFSDAATKAFGSNLAFTAFTYGSYAIFSGDFVPVFGDIDNNEYVVWANDYDALSTGYLLSDLNGSGDITNDDYVIWVNNYDNLVTLVKP